MSTEIDSPFASRQMALGAVVANFRDRPQARSFAGVAGDTEGEAPLACEVKTLREGCGIFDRSATATLEMTGEDRQRFLGGLVTCDTKTLSEGESCYGFFTTVKGRIMADLVAHALEDRLWLELPPRMAEPIQTHMARYIIVDRVEIAPLGRVLVSLIGPGSEAFLADLGLAAPGLSPRSHRPASLAGHDIRVMREPDLGSTPQWSLWLPDNGAAQIYDLLIERGRESATARPVGFAAYEQLRIMAGWPLFGVDYDATSFPQETTLEEAVSYTKGCYLGQEVVARIHYRGGVNKSLRAVRLASEAPTAVGKSILADGRAAGTLTSLTATPDGAMGLAILHQRVENDTEVEIEGHGAARVVALPSP